MVLKRGYAGWAFFPRCPMKPLKAMALLLAALAAAPAVHSKDKKNSLPEVFRHAHTVYVEAVDGREFDQNLDPSDREAIADIRDALHAWGRYTYTAEREQADLVFVVRKGRIADANGGFGAGNGPMPEPRGGQMPGQQPAGGPVVEPRNEIGATEDLLEVCQMNANNKRSAPLWRRTFPGGLDSPRLVLFKEFKEDVESAYPNPPANQPLTQPANQPAKP
jgi:hypothetical protein